MSYNKVLSWSVFGIIIQDGDTQIEYTLVMNNIFKEEEVEYEKQEKERIPGRTYGLNDDGKFVKWNQFESCKGGGN